jgi:hypothetical protein
MIRLQKKQRSELDGVLLLLLLVLPAGSGTPHKPSILGANGHVLHESTAMANYLMASGVAAGDILKVRLCGGVDCL